MITDFPPGTLHSKVLKLLRERPRTLEYKDIADELGVSVTWVKRFAVGDIQNPSVNVVEKLYNVLTGETLNV